MKKMRRLCSVRGFSDININVIRIDNCKLTEKDSYYEMVFEEFARLGDSLSKHGEFGDEFDILFG